ncbi:hypothetical protein ACFT1A_19120 [Rhodococcus sp. NPDC057135]|uniref:hypothetical protein n=1 Tax=Rhodococcus sp. NPDC057135 TaxID=3346028 RepID=UPI00363EE005
MLSTARAWVESSDRADRIEALLLRAPGSDDAESSPSFEVTPAGCSEVLLCSSLSARARNNDSDFGVFRIGTLSQIHLVPLTPSALTPDDQAVPEQQYLESSQ